MAKNENIASVLAFEKKLVPSDGYLYGTTWEHRKNQSTPLRLQEKSVRGTISNRLKKALQDNPAKLDAEIKKSNLKKFDSSALSIDQDTLKLHFTLKILSGVQVPSACNNPVFNKTYSTAANTYIVEEGFSELAKRYAINIANGRFLWRNRISADNIEVEVKVINKSAEQTWIFDATTISMRHFNNNHTDIESLATKIAEALSGKSEFLSLEINAYAQIGKAQDVYPSQELVLNKGNSHSKKSKILYHINDIAGIHSQKLGNALRTIDTWYPEHGQGTMGPISIEPYGVVTNLGKAYRNLQQKADFYTLFDRFARGGALAKNDEHFVMAVLVRGGVFGERENE